MSSHTLSRKQFLSLAAAGAAFVGFLPGCSGDDASPGGDGGAGTGGGAGSGGAGTAGSGAGKAGSSGAGTGGAGAGSGGGAGKASGGAGSGSGGAGSSSGGAGASSGGASSGGMGGAGMSGGAGTAGAGGSGGGSCGADIMVTSSGDHNHSLLITAAQLAAGTDVTILSGTTLSHAHYVHITAADFTALKAGMEVKKKSCAGGDHEYVLKCGGGGSEAGTPTCSDECGDGTDMSKAC